MRLLSIALLCCLFGPVASAGAAPPDFSEQALLARLALQQAQLTAGDGAAGDLFGSAVALSGDTALVAAWSHATAGKESAGAAYVFVRTGGVWTQQQKLSAGDAAAGDEFGSAVALSGDTALVGAWSHATAGKESAGAAYVFVRTGDVWTQQQLSAGDGAEGDSFGSAVALSGDTALVSAQYHSTAGKADADAAYVFVRTGDVWTQQQMLSAGDGAAGDEFGSAVALSGDTALVGAQYQEAAGKTAAGAAYVFVRTGDVWTQQQMLSAGDGAAGDEFGSSVALSGDTALVGAPGRHAAGKEWAGAAYVFLLNPAPHPEPKIAKVTPASGKRGALVTITGSGFGARGSTSAVKFGSKTCTKYVSWSAAQIKCKVPMTAKYGTVKVTVTTSAGKSNALTFTVKR